MTSSAAPSHSSARLDVVGALTRVQESAETTLDDRQLVDVPPTDGGERMVEVHHSVVDQAREHQHHSEGCGGLTLEIGVGRSLCGLDGLDVQPALGLEIVTLPSRFVPEPALGARAGRRAPAGSTARAVQPWYIAHSPNTQPRNQPTVRAARAAAPRSPSAWYCVKAAS